MTRYINADQLVAINARHGGPGAGVRNLLGIQAAADRPAAGFAGHEEYEDVWSKAAVLLHGIASTQHFNDGNKRTAWIAADLFLELNGAPLRDIPRITAEAFVLAVSTNLFDIGQAAEWFKENRVRASDRLDFAFIAGEAAYNDEESSTWDATAASLGGIVSEGFPVVSFPSIVFRIKWRLEDVGTQPDLRLTVHTIDAGTGIVAGLIDPHQFDFSSMPSELPPPELLRITEDLVFDSSAPVQTGHPHYPNGVMPYLSIQTVPLVVYRPGQVRLVIRSAGEVLFSLPFTVSKLPDQRAHDEIAAYLEAVRGQ